MSQLVCAEEYLDRMSAEIGRAMLEAHGIGAHVQGDDMGGTRPDLLPIGRVRLLVQENDLQEAKDLLAEQVVETEDHPEDKKPEVAEYKKRIRRGFIAAILGYIILPPVLTHAYALWMLLPALENWGQFTAGEKAKAVIGTSLSVAMIVLCVLYFAGVFD